MFDDGILGGIFDINGDGELNAAESAAECSFLDDEKKELISELKSEGLDFDDLSLMDETERREALEDAGLDPDDYDEFDFL